MTAVAEEVLVLDGKILPPVDPRTDLRDPPIFLLQAAPTWVPGLQDGSWQRVNIGATGQVLTVQADGSVNWQNSAAGFANPMTTLGDLIEGGVGGTPTRFPIGSNGQVLTVSGSSLAWVNNSTVGFANPMTTPQDLIVGGTAGAATRFPVGSNGQVLTVVGGVVTWANASTGFANPMTTLGDIITGATGGTAQRLGVGSNAQVLTVSGGVPTWQNSASGFTNPMTTTGDMIFGNPGSTPARLGVGSNGQVLTVSGGVPQWLPGSAGPSAVVFPSGDTSGVLDQAAITATWTTGPLVNGGELILAPGLFYVKPTAGLNCLQPPVQTSAYPPASTLPGLPVSIRGCGPATVLFPVGAGVTGIFYHRTSTYGGQYGNPAQPQTGYLRDFVIDGTFTSGAAIGLDYGDGWGYDLDLAVVNFDGTGAIGVQQINRHFWTEKNEHIHLRLSNNSTAFYITTALAPGGDHSSEYNMYYISMFCNANQQGVVVDGVNMGGSYIWMQGNMSISNGSGAAPPGNIAALSITNTAGVTDPGGHRWYAGGIYLKIEGNPGNGTGTTMPYCMYSDGVGYVRQCVVSINGSQLLSSNWNGAEFSATGNISADPGLLAAQTSSAVYAGGNTNPNGLVVVGNVAGVGTVATFTNTGVSPTNVPVLFQAAAAGDHLIGNQVIGDTNPRWKADVGGDLKWGPGNTDTDVDLGRNAAGVLQVAGGTLGTANVGLRVTGSAESYLYLAEGAKPATPTGGGLLYVSNTGALFYLSPAGTNTQIGPP